MKQKRTLFTGIAIGVLTSFLVSMMVVPGFAAGIRKTITAYVGDIDIYVDNVLKIPTDANGNRVEPMIYDGTTYLPVRAISNMLGEDVTWDGDTRSIYIGEKPSKGEKSVSLDTLTPYSANWCELFTGKDAQFTLLDEVQTPFNCLKFKWTSSAGHASNTRISTIYKLNSDYSEIHGYFVEPYTYLGDTDPACIQFYSVDQYGEKTLIKSYNTKAADSPVEIKVPLYGVNFLRIEMASSETSQSGTGCFYNITLKTVD